MMNRDERIQDVIDNCDILLARLSGHAQTDATPQGRMIAQLKWLKEHAEAGTLTLPVDRHYTATLRHVYTEGMLSRLTATGEEYEREIEIYEYRLMKLVKKAAHLLKPEYYPYAVRCIEALIALLHHAPRPLSGEERESITELGQIRDALAAGRLEPPLRTWRAYPNFRQVYSIVGSTIDDLPDGKALCRTVADLIFEGVRPRSWVTPEVADKETAALARH